MDNAQKAIMIGVGLFITIIIISAVLLITNIGTGLITDAQGQLSNISAALQNQVTQAYDGKTMTGADVVAAWTQYQNSEMSLLLVTKGNDEAYTGKYQILFSNLKDAPSDGSAVVNTKSYPGGVYYTADTYADISTKTTLTKLQASGDDNFGVNAANTYYASVIRDAGTDTVIGVVFVQK